MQKLVQFGDDTYDEERAIKKLFRGVPEKYKQMARGVESLIDLSTMTIEEAIGRLKVSSAPTSHNLRQDLSPFAGGSTSLGSSGRSTEVTGRRGAFFRDRRPQARQTAQS
jgi:hypothetical protein